MPRKQVRTSNYTQAARDRLARAVERARIAAGYKYRTEFCRAHGIKNLRGLELLEQGLTGVGQAFLFEVARALPGWTEDTPKAILEGAEPPTPPGIEDRNRPVTPEIEPDDEGWTDADEELMEKIRGFARKHGIERVTATLVNALREEWERERAERDQHDQSG